MTAIVRVDPERPDPEVIARASDILRRGGLVALPTETVYGLAADASSPAAVGRVFAAKGRPAHNPIIVHVADAAAARQVTRDWPEAAVRLAEHFWPGPLTLVLPKSAAVPDEVTAGGHTVAVRVPAHPVALAVLRAAGLALAAPSANASGELSPTRAEHVLRSLAGRIELVLDAGPTSGGLESTVLDLTTEPPRLLRPGLVTLSELESVLGTVVAHASQQLMGEGLKSPGMLERHDAPRTPLECVAGDPAPRLAELVESGLKVGYLTYKEDAFAQIAARTLQLPSNARQYGAKLYTALHQLDAAGLDRILVRKPDLGEEWLAILDRLRRAAVNPF